MLCWCLDCIVKGITNAIILFFLQDSELSDGIRKLPGVPLLFISHNAITLESPSDKSRRKASGLLDEKMGPASHEQSRLEVLKKEVLGEEVPKKKKRKGPKGANPLSCQKKKKKPEQSLAQGEGKKKRHRKRKRHKAVENVQSSLWINYFFLFVNLGY